MTSIDIEAVKNYLLQLQDTICNGLESADGSARLKKITGSGKPEAVEEHES